MFSLSNKSSRETLPSLRSWSTDAAPSSRPRSKRLQLSTRLLLLFIIIFVLGAFHIHYSQQWMKATGTSGDARRRARKRVPMRRWIRSESATAQDGLAADDQDDESGDDDLAFDVIFNDDIVHNNDNNQKSNKAEEKEEEEVEQQVEGEEVGKETAAAKTEQASSVDAGEARRAAQRASAAQLLAAKQTRAKHVATNAALRQAAGARAVVERERVELERQKQEEALDAAVAAKQLALEKAAAIEKERNRKEIANDLEKNDERFSFTGASWNDEKSMGQCFNEVSYGVFGRLADKNSIINTGIASLDDSSADVSTNSGVTCRMYSHPQYLKNDATMCDLRDVAINWKNVDRPKEHLWNTNIRYTLKQHAIVVQLDSHDKQQHHLLQKAMIQSTNVAGEVELVHADDGAQSLTSRCSASNTLPAKLVMTVGRADDHCPFFVTSIILNAWMMLEFLGVHPNDAQLMFLDDGDLAARHLPYDDMIKQAITPKHDIVYGGRGTAMDSHGGFTCFKRLVTLPQEYASPIMSRLNAVTPCGKSSLITDFARHIMNKSLPGNPLTSSAGAAAAMSRRPRVTILYRRRHAQRQSIQRRIANEAQLTSAFEREPMFKGQVKALDFGASSWSFEQQAQVMQDTDVLVGFHGAQLVNALWLPEGSTVIEVFAQGHHRYTYDHISKYMGHEYVRIETHQRSEPVNGFTVPVADVVRRAVEAVKKQRNH